MKWEVSGADRQSGADRKLVVDADDEPQAKRRANRQGVLVEGARPLDPNDSVVGAPVGVPPPLLRPDYEPVINTANRLSFAPVSRQVQSSLPRHVLVEQTSKAWKAQILGAAALTIGSLFVMVLAVPTEQPAFGIIGGLMFLGGLGWFIVARIGSWWDHG